MIVTELLFTLLILCLGYLLAKKGLAQTGAVSFSAALPIGSLAYVLVALLFSVRVYHAFFAAWLVLCGPALFLLWRLKKESLREESSSPAWFIVVLSLAMAGVLFTFTNYLFIRFSPDSYDMRLAGDVIAWLGYLPQSFLKSSAILTGGGLSFRPIFLPMVQAAAAFLGQDFLGAYFPLIVVLLLGLMWASYVETEPSADPRIIRQGRAVMAGLILVFITSPFVLFQAAYYNGHVLTAFFFLLFGLASLRLIQSQGRTGYLLLAAAGVGLIFLRLENYIIVPVLAVVIAFRVPVRSKDMWLSWWPVFLLTAPWLCFLFLYGERSYFLSPRSFALSLFCLAAPLWLVPIVGRESLRKVMPWITAAVILAALAAGGLWQPAATWKSWQAVWANVGPGGDWGYLGLIVILAALAWMPARFAGPETKLLGQMVILFIILNFLALYMRLTGGSIAFRVGWFDSFNRMLLHAAPLAAVGLGLLVRDALSRLTKTPASSGKGP